MIRRLATDDEDDVMPPPKQKNPVSAEQVEVLKRWIREGAEYQGHWAYTAPVRPGVTESENEELA